MAATIAVVYPHMNGDRRRRLLAGPGAGRADPRHRGLRAGRLHWRRSGAIATRATTRSRPAAGRGAHGGRGSRRAGASRSRWPRALRRADCPSTCCSAMRSGTPAKVIRSARSEARYACQGSQALHGRSRLRRDLPGRGQAAGGRHACDRCLRWPIPSTQLSHAGLGDFYRGDVGREIAADLERIGSPGHPPGPRNLSGPRGAAALARGCGNATVYNLPPPSQGLASLLMLGMFERLGVRPARRRAPARADRGRQARLRDPRPGGHRPGLHADDPADFLTAAVLEREAAVIDMRRAAPFPLPRPVDGDTVWMGCIDRDGLAVSYIQSVFWAFGSGCVLPANGHPLAEPRAWASRSIRRVAEPAGARAASPSTPSIRPSPSSTTGACSPTGPWAATGSRRSRPDLHPLCGFRHGPRRRGRCAALAASARAGGRLRRP